MRIKNINMENIIVSNAKEGVVLSEADEVNMKNIKIELLKKWKELEDAKCFQCNDRRKESC